MELLQHLRELDLELERMRAELADLGQHFRVVLGPAEGSARAAPGSGEHLRAYT